MDTSFPFDCHIHGRNYKLTEIKFGSISSFAEREEKKWSHQWDLLQKCSLRWLNNRIWYWKTAQKQIKQRMSNESRARKVDGKYRREAREKNCEWCVKSLEIQLKKMKQDQQKWNVIHVTID